MTAEENLRKTNIYVLFLSPLVVEESYRLILQKLKLLFGRIYMLWKGSIISQLLLAVVSAMH